MEFGRGMRMDCLNCGHPKVYHMDNTYTKQLPCSYLVNWKSISKEKVIFCKCNHYIGKHKKSPNPENRKSKKLLILKVGL